MHLRPGRSSASGTRRSARPHSLALRSGEASLSYGDLTQWAERIARGLLSQGLTPGARVGVLGDRSLEFVAGMLGVLKAGGVYVPLDARLPVDRLAYQLNDSGAEALLSAVDTEVGWAGAVPVLPLRHEASWQATASRLTVASALTAASGPIAAPSPHTRRISPGLTFRAIMPPTSSTPPAPPAAPRA